MGYGLGIDLGTTSLKAAWYRDGRSGLVQLSPWSIEAPALTHLTGLDESAWLSGPGSRAEGRATSLVREAKPTVPSGRALRHNDLTIPPERVLGHQIRWVYEASVVHLGAEPDHVVVARPATWNESAVQRLASAVADLGRVPPTLVTEAEAAATALGSPSENGAGPAASRSVVVVDGGSSGTEITGLRLDRLGRYEPATVAVRDAGLAGEKLIEAVAAHLARSRAEVSALAPADGDKLARWALTATSRHADRRFVLPGGDGTSAPPVTRTEIEQVALPLIDGVVQHLRAAIAGTAATSEAPPDVLLTGGLAHLPVFAARMRELLGVEPMTSDAPAHDVARGAAHLAVEASRSPVEPPSQEGPGDGSPVSTVSRFRQPSNATFTAPTDDVAADDDGGVSEVAPDLRLAVVAVIIVVGLGALLLAGRLWLGG